MFTCEVVGYHGGGAPTIHWYTVTRDGLTNSPESQWDPISKKSSITFTPEVEDDGKEIGCRNPESGQVTAEAGDAVVPAYTASDCLSYIYVAWILFIYSVGLGAEAASFYQVSRAQGRS